MSRGEVTMSQWVDKHRLRIGMAQINTTVGDFAGNRQKILKAINEARDAQSMRYLSITPALPGILSAD